MKSIIFLLFAFSFHLNAAQKSNIKSGTGFNPLHIQIGEYWSGNTNGVFESDPPALPRKYTPRKILDRLTSLYDSLDFLKRFESFEIFDPNKEYFESQWLTENQIQVLSGDDMRADHLTFAILGDSTSQGPMLIKKIFDPEHSRKVFRRWLKHISGLGVDFMMHVGDMTESGTLLQYTDLIMTLNEHVNYPFLTTIGNHDLTETRFGPLPVYYNKAFGETNYYFDYRDFRFIVIDTSYNGINKESLAWLEKALFTGLRKVVFTHRPPAEILARNERDDHRIDPGCFNRGSLGFVNLMALHEVERVYVGHIHGFEAIEHRGVEYRITAGGGSPLYPVKQRVEKIYNIVVVTITADGRFTETLHYIDGDRKGDGPIRSRPVSSPGL
ncbi:metallophosphoesterase family protein [Elusimicrobiota bacterium]